MGYVVEYEGDNGIEYWCIKCNGDSITKNMKHCPNCGHLILGFLPQCKQKFNVGRGYECNLQKDHGKKHHDMTFNYEWNDGDSFVECTIHGCVNPVNERTLCTFHGFCVCPTCHTTIPRQPNDINYECPDCGIFTL